MTDTLRIVRQGAFFDKPTTYENQSDDPWTFVRPKEWESKLNDEEFRFATILHPFIQKENDERVSISGFLQSEMSEGGIKFRSEFRVPPQEYDYHGMIADGLLNYMPKGVSLLPAMEAEIENDDDGTPFVRIIAVANFSFTTRISTEQLHQMLKHFNEVTQELWDKYTPITSQD